MVEKKYGLVEKMKRKKYHHIVLSSTDEKILFNQIVKLFKNSPIPEDEILDNLGLYLTSKNLARILFFYEIYKKIIHNTHGVIIEFGVRWGPTLALMIALRSMFEPFNRHRKIIGFDTFEGFKGVSKEDGKVSKCKNGSFSVSEGYEFYLDKILECHEKINPMSHIKRYEIIKGDAVETVPEYFRTHPETIVALAIFDLDIYKPTKVALETIKPYLCKGSILVFDELSDAIFPGETIALKEVIGLNNLRIQRYPFASRISYVIIE